MFDLKVSTCTTLIPTGPTNLQPSSLSSSGTRDTDKRTDAKNENGYFVYNNNNTHGARDDDHVVVKL